MKKCHIGWQKIVLTRGIRNLVLWADLMNSVVIWLNQQLIMGLSICFYFKEGKDDTVNMCYSSFSEKVMDLEEMIKWGFTDHDGQYTGPALEFLIDRLVAAGYLKEKYDPMPIKAVFC